MHKRNINWWIIWYKGSISESAILVSSFAGVVSDSEEGVVEEVEYFLEDRVFGFAADMDELLIDVEIHY